MAGFPTTPKLKWINARGLYYISWYERGKERVRSTGTASRTDAQTELEIFIAETRLRSKEDAHPDNLLIAEVLAFYAEHHAPHVASPERIAYAVDALLPYWGEKTVSQISKRTVREFTEKRARSVGTLRKELGVLVAAMNFCVKERLLTQAPHIELPPKPDPKDRWLTYDEAAALLWESRKGGRNSRSYLPLAILIALYTGARIEAILSLTWQQVDLSTGLIDFQNPGRARTKKRRPTVPIPRNLMTFMRYAYAKRPRSFDRRIDGGPVVHNQGEPITRIIRGFKAAADRAGLEGVTPHTLRHTRGTWLAQQGVKMFNIAGWLGQDVTTTERIYAHQHPDFMEEAKQAAENRPRKSLRVSEKV